MTTLLWVVTAILLLAAPASAGDGSVGIDVDLGGKRTVLGSGFFYTRAGDVLTAYHVVHRARGIRVFHDGQLHTDVVVERLLPEADLAHLRVRGLRGGVPFFALARDFRNEQALRPVTVIGYPRGLAPGHRFSGHITQAGFMRSEQLHEPQTGRRLFRSEGLRLLSLDVSAYTGLSGSPVVTDVGVVGVFSGSLHEGRGLSWAIPLSYLGSMQKVGRPAHEITQWADLVMSQYWRSLAKVVRVEDGVRKAVDDYFRAAEDVRAAQEDALAQATLAIPALAALRREIAAAEAEAQAGRMPSISALKGWWRVQWPHIEAAYTAIQRWQLGHLAATTGIARIGAEVELSATTPSGSEDRNRRFEQAARRLYERLARTLKGSELTSFAEDLQNGLRGAMGVVGDAQTPRTPDEAARLLGALRQGITSLERAFTTLTSPDTRLALGTVGRVYGEIGRLVEQYIYEEDPG